MKTKRYVVPVSGSSYIVPPFCTCCLKPTNSKKRICCEAPTFGGRKIISLYMPLCDECANHCSAKPFLNKIFLALALSVVIQIISILIFANFSDVASNSIISVIFGVISFCAFLAFAKAPDIHSPHTSRDLSCEIISFAHFMQLEQLGISVKHDNGLAFVFYNYEYAKVFKEANGNNADEIVVINGNNEMENMNLLSAVAGIQYYIILSIIIFAIIVFAFIKLGVM